jgi:hypothetical protein
MYLPLYQIISDRGFPGFFQQITRDTKPQNRLSMSTVQPLMFLNYSGNALN